MMIEFKNISFGYKNEKNIFDNFSFLVREQERWGILGFNGAGKSTLIKMMLGIIKPQVGEILIENNDIWTCRKKIIKNIGVVWGQKTTLWWDIPVISSYEMLKKIYKISDAEYASRMQYFDSMFELSAFWKQPLRTLSLGQRAKTEIVASLLHDPCILVYDEPFLGLDFITREKIIDFLNDYCTAKKCVLILTSHNLEDIESLCDKILLLNAGIPLFAGKKSELCSNYDTLHQVDFIYEENDLYISPELSAMLIDIIHYEHKTRVIFDARSIEYDQVVAEVLRNNKIIGIETNRNFLEQVIKQVIERTSSK